MKRLLQTMFLALLLAGNAISVVAQEQSGETVTLDGKKYKLLSENLISNPGFEEGFTGWTDATTSAATLTSSNFTIANSGGVGNSKYLVGTKNEDSGSAGSIGTGWRVEAGKTYYFSYQVKYLSASNAGASEQYLKVSLTNNKTSAAEPRVLLNAAQVNGGGKWTQNAVVFTNSNPAYSYVVARFRWLSNNFGFDDFMLHEVSEVPNTDGLQELISLAQSLYDPQGDGAEELQAAITKAEEYLTSESATEVLQAMTDLEEVVTAYKYANASPENPLDMTSYIVNQGFDDNNDTGWTGGGVVNYHEVEFYETTFDMYQHISGLPAGKYRMKVQGFERPKGNDSGAAYKNGTETIYARFYAKATDFSEKTVSFNSLYRHTYSGTGSSNGYVNTMEAAETMLTNSIKGYYETTLSDILINEGGVLTIGAKTDFKQNGYWALFDNFRLEYVGAFDINDFANAINERIAEAQTLLTKNIQSSVITDLNAAIAQAQQAVAANPLVNEDLSAAKELLDKAIDAGDASVAAYNSLQEAIDAAAVVLGFLDKDDEIEKLNAAIAVAKSNLENPDLTLAEINKATADLKQVASGVGKQIYIPGWMMGNVNDPDNSWSYTRSKQSKNWIIFWEPGYGDNPSTHPDGNYRVNVEGLLELAEKSYKFYADSLKFITSGSSKADKYKMIIRLRYTREWEATGSGVDDMIGLLTLTAWSGQSGGVTLAHEVGHCFQYQVHCDNNNQNGWMYGFGDNASGGNGFWEQCAQWQAFKIFPDQQFTDYRFSEYLNTVHKHILHETPRYANYFIQDYWCDLHGMDFIGRLWNESKRPEDPVEAYIRITGIKQSQFNDEMYDCAARFATWDIEALRSYGKSKIASRPQPKMNNAGDDYWIIDPSVCLENYGHNIIRLNTPKTAQTVKAFFQGRVGADGYRTKYVARAGWRYGFVALQKDGTRVYGDMHAVSGAESKDTISFECPANCDKLWLVVTGAPSIHWRHAWDDNDSNDEHWPYQVKFDNTNLYGKQNVVSVLTTESESNVRVYTSGNNLFIKQLPEDAVVRICNIAGICIVNEQITDSEFLTTLPAGIYVINVQSRYGNHTQKVIIQ